MNPHSSLATTGTDQEATKSEHEIRLTLSEFIEIDNAIRRSDFPFLQKYVKGRGTDKKDEVEDVPRVNLSKDPLLNVMIAYGGKTESLVLELIKMMTPQNLMAKNEVGDTALHVAAAKDSLAVATALIEKNQDLMVARNNKFETPLLKAALFGSANTFRKLRRERPHSISDRTSTGASVLHCAILGNNPELALEIAQEYGWLMYRRNLGAVTPLQLIVTIPEVFRSTLVLGFAESFLYAFIPLDSHDESNREKIIDDEERGKSISHNYWVESNAKSDKLFEESEAMSSRNSLKKYQLIWYFFYIVKLIGYYLDAAGVRRFIILILKQLFNRVEELEILKKNHVQTLKLIAYIARDPEYWDFINKGMFKKKQTDMEPEDMIFKKEIIGDDDDIADFDFDDDDDDDDDEDDDDDDDDDEIDNRNAVLDDSNERSLNERTTGSLPKERKLILEQKDLILEQKNLILEQKNFISEQKKLIKEFKKQIKTSMPTKRQPTRWADSPLIVGAKMGLYDFVEQILKVYPQSAQYRDLEGRNVLQVAINNGHEKIVKIIAEMINGPNPVLPSWLLSHVNYDKVNKDDEMGTMSILHYAAVTTNKGEGFAFQMQREIKWFEMVKKLVPKDVVNSRNVEEKTAQELFIENHADMMKSGRNELKEIGKTCAGLLAAVVFATSFNMPQGKDSNSSTSSNNNNMTANNYTTAKGSNFNDQSVGFKVFSHTYVIGLSFATTSLILFLSLLTSNYRAEAFRTSLPTKYILAVASFFFGLIALLVAFTCNIYLSIYGGGIPKAKELLPLILELTAFPYLCGVALFLGGFSLPVSDFILRIFHK